MRETSEEGEAVAIVIARGLCRYSCCGRRGLSRGAVRLLVAVIVAEFQPSARRCWFDASGKPIDRVRVYLPNVPPPRKGVVLELPVTCHHIHIHIYSPIPSDIHSPVLSSILQ